MDKALQELLQFAGIHTSVFDNPADPGSKLKGGFYLNYG